MKLYETQNHVSIGFAKATHIGKLVDSKQYLELDTCFININIF